MIKNTLLYTGILVFSFFFTTTAFGAIIFDSVSPKAIGTTVSPTCSVGPYSAVYSYNSDYRDIVQSSSWNYCGGALEISTPGTYYIVECSGEECGLHGSLNSIRLYSGYVSDSVFIFTSKGLSIPAMGDIVTTTTGRFLLVALTIILGLIIAFRWGKKKLKLGGNGFKKD